MKPRVSPGYRIRTETEQVSPYSPEQSSLPESEGLSYVLLFRFSGRRLCLLGHAPFDPFRFILPGFLSGSAGNSHSSTQMNSHSDSGYQDANSGYSGQNMSKSELRMQHSFPGAVVRNTRAEGQAAAQVLPILYRSCCALLFVGLSHCPFKSASD